ncbi:hypothetical protein [Telmatospirillum sp.]|nr:hypothetical protein [Telmatospirillum sp.]MDR3438338.1 hypothetical protein [Telmatospirillum sp.]
MLKTGIALYFAVIGLAVFSIVGFDGTMYESQQLSAIDFGLISLN